MALFDKFVIVDDKKMNVYSQESFFANRGSLMGDDQTAIEFTFQSKIDDEEKVCYLPLKTLKPGTDLSSCKPGWYSNGGPFAFVVPPSNPIDEGLYCPPKERVFDMQNIASMQQMVQDIEVFQNTLNALMETDPEDDSVYTPPLLDSDSAEMRGLKIAIASKRINLDKYKDRFGDNYLNDKRKLRDDNITSFLLKRMCQNLDIEVDIIFRDAPGNIPNPMNRIIKVNLSPGTGESVIMDDIEETTL